MPLPERASPLKMSRRRSLQVGTASAAAMLVASPPTAPPAQAADLPPGPATPAFMVELPVYTAKQPVASLTPASTQLANVGGECGRPAHQRRDDFAPQKLHTLNVREALHSFHPDLPAQKIRGYDGIYPGPTFAARYGEPIVVRIYNDLPRHSMDFGSPEISTHLHNLHCGSESDGFAGDCCSAANYGPTLTGAGGYKDHHYPNFYAGYDQFGATNGDPREALGTLWYHDHRDGFTAPNVSKGLTGLYLLFDDIDSGDERDPDPKALRLPNGVGRYDIPLVFQDKQFDSSGYLFGDPFENDGVLGNKFCVNGKVQPFFKVERRKYRFRLLDGGPSRFYEIYLTTPNHAVQSLCYIANDGNFLPAPLTMSKVPLAPAERADIAIDFSRYDTGTSLFLVNRLAQTDGKGPEGESANGRSASGLLTRRGTQILRFDIGTAPALADVSQVPALLRALPDIDLKQVARTRRFSFDKSNSVWTVNGNIYNGEIATAKPRRGSAAIWMLEGSGDWHHPVHIHFEEGRILTRNGQPPPGPARRQARLAQADGRRADAGAGRPGQPQRGRTVLFNMMQSVRAGICPANTANLLEVQQALGSRIGKDIFMVSMTLQPEFDTPDALREYVGRYGIQPGWTFLTGPPCRCSAARPAVPAAGRRPVPTRSGRRAGTGSWSAGLPVYWPSAQIGVSVVTACQD